MAINEIDDLLYKFLWDGKGDKTKHTVVINDYQEEGIKMLDIKSFNFALKVVRNSFPFSIPTELYERLTRL